MAYQTVFKRYEIKYLLTREQQKAILLAMEPHMTPDAYGPTTIRNLYFDTDNYRLIRRSIERPDYKEKLRIRSYRRVGLQDEVFVELKKKFKGVVYKRRLVMTAGQAEQWLQGGAPCPAANQIAQEINYFMSYYESLAPKVYLSYDRQAYVGENDFRVTFDENIRARQDDLSLDTEPGGKALLPENTVLMELKTGGAIPLWMTRELTRLKIYKASFSKYGKAYEQLIFHGGMNDGSAV